MGEPDIAVVGAGIVGLAVARELARRDAQRRIVVLEREQQVAVHQTGHNSGVAHAGIYYPAGSLKARLCVEGRLELAGYCEARGLAYERCGKLIVALDRGELPALDELERRGAANGVGGLRRVDAAGLRALEPHATGIAALHSAETAIVDFAAVARALADDLRAAGGEIVTGAAIEAIEPRAPRAAGASGSRRIVLRHSRGELAARFAVFCAGGASDRLAVLAGAAPDPRIVPFRGAYLKLVPRRRALVRGLIYPVPDPRLPFLGVHLTRHIGGDVLIGPTALLAPASARRLLETLSWPGTWRMARRWWRTGVTEVHHALSPAALIRAAARYVPELEPGDAEPAWAGVRAQAVARDGRLLDDFAFSHTERALHVRNAPSPAATAALAIARHVADETERAL
jgi:(S)-2-hydroxyglutarate dehydrogenase